MGAKLGVLKRGWAALLMAPLLALAACSGEGPAVEGLPTEGPVSEFSLPTWQAGTRYSALDQINAENVRSLQVAWEYHTGEIDMATDAMVAFEDEPILVEGNLIICTISRRVIALDPATGAERWVYDPGGDTGRVRKCRGVTAWTDAQAPADAPCKTRILWATADNRLIAIDARTGAACPGFGREGVVQIESTVPELFRGELTSASRPAVVNGVVIIGSAVADNQRLNGPSGRVMAYDARTGAFRWSFDPLPRASDRNNPAARTWTNGNAGELGGGNVWSTMSADEERGLVYLPTTSPLGDFYAANRPGDNLYANSLVAVRAATGEVVWHFQFVHHDVWDYDLPVGPLLIDYPVNGRNVPALVQLTKQGLIYIFNRETGEPLVPIEERPVPQEGAAPGEVLSPTQPFPVGMPAIAPQGFSEDDAWGFTPIDRGSCRDRVRELRAGPIFTPPSTEGTVFMPGSSGGANWGGGAYDPQSNILVVPSARVPMVMTLVPREEGANVETGSIETRGAMNFPIEGSPYTYRMEPLMSSFGAPCGSPPWQALVAVNLVTREIVWEVPLGTIEKLAPVPIPVAMGTPGAGGPLTTAGGVVFIGHTLDHRFRAFDLRTGEQLWQSRPLPAPATATPITYEAGGSQYVVIAAGGHSMYSQARSDTVMAYRLRRE